MEQFDVKQDCAWCGSETVQSFPAKETDTPLVRRGNNKVICHSCVKHLAVIVLDQENRIERENYKASRK